jgi:nucleotide-binding universal stress UspA family protein
MLSVDESPAARRTQVVATNLSFAEKTSRRCPVQTVEVLAQVAVKQILFLTDFSSRATSAFPYAMFLARSYGSKILLTHILPPTPRHSIPLEPIPDVMHPDYLQAKQEVKQFLSSSPFGDVPYEVVVERGELWPTVSEIIAQHNVDLIVLATHGRHGIGKLLLGSVAEEVFRLAACPVLTVGPNAASHGAEIRKVLFATDFCWSMHALPYALSLAKKNHAHLTLLHVLPEPGMADAAQETYEMRASNEAEVIRELRSLVPAEEAYFQQNSDVMADYGTPGESILAIAKERDAGLIVMGVRRSDSIFAATHLPWATAHKVVAEATCPVLTVRD